MRDLSSTAVHPAFPRMRIECIVDGLKECTLPPEEWTHEAHCLTALFLLVEGDRANVAAELECLIRRYNEATGTPNDDSSGYHHTITLFFTCAIGAFLDGRPGWRLEEMASDLLASPIGEPRFIRGFYSASLLQAPSARRGWVEPDLRPMSDIELLRRVRSLPRDLAPPGQRRDASNTPGHAQRR
jgi:hypothetical protein